MIQYLVSGMVVGCIFAIAAAEITGVTYRATAILNFGFGGLAYGIARVYYFLLVQHGWPFWIAAVVSICVVSPALGALLYIALLRLLTDASTLIKVIVTIGIGVTVPALATLALGTVGVTVSPGLAPIPVAHFQVLGVAIDLDQLIVMISLVVILLLGFILLRFTEVGLLVRATVDSPAMTSLNGSSPNLVCLVVWMISTTIAGLVGVLIAPIIGLSIDNFGILAAGAFSAVLIARLTNVGRAVLVCLAFGISTAIVQYFFPPTSPVTTGMLAAVPFAFVISFLLWELRRSQAFAPPIVTRELDRAIATSSDVAKHGSSGTLALRLHYPTNGAGGKESFLTGRSIRALILAAIVGVIPAFLSPFWAGEMGVGIAFAIVFLSFTLVIGEGGMLWLCQVAFAGIGAAMTAYLTSVDHVPILASIFFSGLLVVPAGLLLAALTSRVGQLAAALATLAFGVLTDTLILTQHAFAGDIGVGITIQIPAFLTGNISRFYLMFGVFCFLALVVEHFRRSTVGLAAAAARWSPRGASSVGINAKAVQLQIGGLGAFMAAVGGGFLAVVLQGDSPPTFNSYGGLVWLAVAATIGIRSNMAAAVAGVNWAVMPAIFQSFFPLSLSNVPTALFGIGSIFIVNNPDGVVEQHLRQVLWLTKGARWIERQVRTRGRGIDTEPLAIGANGTSADPGERAKVAAYSAPSRDEP